MPALIIAIYLLNMSMEPSLYHVPSILAPKDAMDIKNAREDKGNDAERGSM